MPMTFAGSDDDPEFGIRLSRMINEGYADLIAMHPDRFGAFATLPADGPDEALAELAYALDELRLDGRLFGRPISDGPPGCRGTPLTHLRIEPGCEPVGG
jgi:predicted TIM-barrel fold metal-dependent hydrolase